MLVCRTGRILESLPFVRLKTHFAVDEHFLGRPARFLGVGLDGQVAQRLGRRITQMKIARLVVVPGTKRSLENHSVPGIEEHLRRAAGIFRGSGGFIFLEHQTDIAHAVADIRHFPGTPSHLVEDGGAEIPGNFRLARCGAGVKVAVGGLANVRQRALLDDLRQHHVVQKSGLELIVELLLVHVGFRLLVHLREKGARLIKGLRLFGLLEGSQGLLANFGLDNGVGAAILPHPVGNHDKPQLGLLRLLAYRLKDALGKHAHGSVHALVRLVEVEIFVDLERPLR